MPDEKDNGKEKPLPGSPTAPNVGEAAKEVSAAKPEIPPILTPEKPVVTPPVAAQEEPSLIARKKTSTRKDKSSWM